MSSILKALRRLEEERARKNHEAPAIATSLLRGGLYRRRSFSWVVPLLLIVVLLVSLALFWSGRSSVTAPDLKTLPAQPELLRPPPVAAGEGGVVIIEEVMDQRPVVVEPRVAPPLPAPVTLPPTTRPALQSPEEGRAEPLPERSATVESIPERLNPIVSAIAWQDDASARMAVIDGLPVMTGEVVASAKVVEILPDRILFEEGGLRFIVRVQSP